MGGCIGFLWWNAAPGPDLHGRHRVAGARRPDRGLSILTRPSCCSSSSAGCSWWRRCRWRIQIAVFRTTRRPGVPDGAVPPPLRAGGLGRDHGDHPVLAAGRDVRGARSWGCSTRVADGVVGRRSVTGARTSRPGRRRSRRCCVAGRRRRRARRCVRRWLGLAARGVVDRRARPAARGPAELAGPPAARVRRARAEDAAGRHAAGRHRRRAAGPTTRCWRPRAAAGVAGGRRAGAGLADRRGAAGEPPTWLVVTGTNGKTTTTGMLEAILRAAGLRRRGLRQHRLPGGRRGPGRGAVGCWPSSCRASSCTGRRRCVPAAGLRAQRRRGPPRLARLDGRLRGGEGAGAARRRSRSRASTTRRRPRCWPPRRRRGGSA